MKTQDERYMHFLKDIYYAERAFLEYLPELIGTAASEKLEQALQHHAEKIRAQIGRLDRAFEALDRSAEGASCKALAGVLREFDDVLTECGAAGPIRDAATITCAQAVEHYGIARYGTLAQWNKQWAEPSCPARATPMTMCAAIHERVVAIEDKLIAWRRDIHGHLELGDQGIRTAGLVADHLRDRLPRRRRPGQERYARDQGDRQAGVRDHRMPIAETGFDLARCRSP